MADISTAQWAGALLAKLGIRQTRANTQALVGWANAEGGHWNNQAKYNPLNTTQDMPGAGNTGSQGNIKVYRDWAQGLDATVKTLRNGRYGGILSALHGSDPMAVASAIGQTPWGTGGDLVQRTIASASGAAAPAASLPAEAATPSTPTSPSAASPDAYKAARRTALQQYLATEHTDPNSLLTLAHGLTQAKTLSPSSQPGIAGVSSRRRSSPATALATDAGPLPTGVADFEGKKVAAWIKPALVYARKQGWKGAVNSGFRSDAEQVRIWNSGVRPAAKPQSLGGGGSNHSGTDFPLGAVDVSDAGQLSTILRASPWASKLIYAGAKDPVHFSHPHNGSY